MVVIGLLLLLGVAAVTLAALLRGGDSVRIDLEWFAVRTDVTGVFVAGAATRLLAFLGLWLLGKGLKRNRRKRAEMHALRDRARRADSTDAPGSAGSSSVDGKTRGAERTSRSDGDDHFDSAPRDR